MGALRYLKLLITNIREVIDSSTVMVGDFNTSLMSVDRPSNQKGKSGFE